jgi:agmatine deiminase
MAESLSRQGYRMPAEWERQQAVWISFPHNAETWPSNLAEAQAEMEYLIHFLSESETVRINVPGGYRERLERTFSRELSDDRVFLHDIPTNDAWCRDHGAIFVSRLANRVDIRAADKSHIGLADNANTRSPDDADGGSPNKSHIRSADNANNGRVDDADTGWADNADIRQADNADTKASGLVAVSWGYNAWGGKYPPYDLDNSASDRMAEELGVPVIDGGMILEGGAIEVDGTGTLLTTESCLLNPTRNPSLDRSEIEDRLRRALGVRDILWLEGGDVTGDDTDGHIDNLARFVSADVVVHVISNDRDDENYSVLQRQKDQLQEIATDRGLRLVELPMPLPVVYDGVRLPASYGNFLITNEVVLLPSYGKRDQSARAILRELFPSRVVHLVPTSNLVVGLGSIHCLTQQVPAS